MSATSLASPGTLIRARGREWVVLPESDDELLLVRPIGGLDEEVTGILPAVEEVESASFPLPSKSDLGDFRSGKLLRDAARLSTRAASGPFRSFGRIAAEPRPYQLVPLMMALKLDPIRLLIADDVGIGKTIEASLIARELLDRGEIKRLAVLCPPHLAEQWQRELAQKFHIDAELVLSSTIQRLERDLRVGESVFDRYPVTIVSTDFIKTPRRSDDFALKCPELVIVDEAHGCSNAAGAGKGSHQRYRLLQQISKDPNRHLILVTATPHSGNEDAFRSLLSLLDENFSDLPVDLERAERDGIRRKLSRHLIQRKRVDIRHYLETDTAFPTRKDKETTYAFSTAYRQLFDDILAFAREYVSGDQGERQRRVRYWSALALLRCVSSSPAAAAATLRSRASVDEAESVDEANDLGRRTVLDQTEDDEPVSLDINPGSETEDASDSVRKKLLEFARRAEAMEATDDHKLQEAIAQLKGLVKDGFNPVVFCRFIDTAEYVARELRQALSEKIHIASVTGSLPPSEREARIAELVAEPGSHVLVCTDCLSEGINLQEHFDAIFHYDLAWNPTRHEQREGRVDRFGQRKEEVRVQTFYGLNNPIDGVILDVLISKHKKIKSTLGVTVSVPGSSEQIAEALFEGALFRQSTRGQDASQMTLDFIDDLSPKKQKIHEDWDNARDREKASRSRFAQHTLSPESVQAELENVREAIGRSEDVEGFFLSALRGMSVPLESKGNALIVHLSNQTPRALRQALGKDEPFKGRFDLPLQNGESYLGRTSPLVEGLAGWALDQALDPEARDTRPVAARTGVITSSSVSTRTTLLVVRFRYHLKRVGSESETILCEEILPLGCTGQGAALNWIAGKEAESLLGATPSGNLNETLINQQLELLIGSLAELRSALEPIAKERAELQLESHERVREASRSKGRLSVEPVLPVDIIGAYLILPSPR